MIEAMRNRMEREEGFTLIELLVVILIIGILAAIAIPSFLNQREKGQDACAKSQARTMATSIETFYTDNNNYSATLGDLTGIESAVTATNACGNGTVASVDSGAPTAGACGTAPGAGGSGQAYCVSQTSASGRSFAIYKPSGGAQQRWCGGATSPGGGCPRTTVNGW
jgi:type IV pilus assembly protein PilA